MLLVAPLFVFTVSSAQDDFHGSISGQVIDVSTKRSLEFVNVLLHRCADSSMVSGTTTDATGKFLFPEVAAGEYFCKFGLVGYAAASTRPIPIDPRHKNANLGKQTLRETSVNLQEILVTGEKAMQNNGIDRKVYNVDQDLMSKAGSASELLQNVPSVQVDIDGNVSLRGSSDVLILVNGKNSPLMGTNRAEVLQQMPASTIERIEVITNPTAKYKPDGTSGIINLVLKKNTSRGANGSVSANAGNQGRYNGNIRLAYNPGALNVYGSYSFRQDSRNRINSDARTQTDSTVTFYRQDLGSYADPLSHMANLGFEWELNGATTTGASGHYFHNAFTRTEYAGNTLQDLNHIQTQAYERDRLDHEYQEGYGANAFVEYDFPAEEHKLRAEYSFSGHPETEDNVYTNLYWLPSAPTQFDATLIHPKEIEHQISVDYTDPLSDHTILEAGYAGEVNHGDYRFTVSNFDLSRYVWQVDPGKTNRFVVDRTIHALYATLRQSFGSLGVLAGIRTEYARTDMDQVSQSIALANDYWKVYPTLHLSYNLGETTELQMNYSRRVHRPDTDDLNPFPEYQDPRNLRTGNPTLMPEFIHSVECGVKLQNSLFSVVPSLYYRYTSNRFTSVVQQINDSTLLTTRMNLSNGQSAGLELIASSSLGEWFSSNMSLNTYFDEIDASNLGYSTKKSVITWSGVLTMSLSPVTGTMFQINGSYNSTRLTPQGEYRPAYVVNIGARQDCLDNTLSVTLTVADIFHTLKRELNLDTPLLHQNVINKRDAGIVYLGLTWRFGTETRKAKGDDLKYDDGI
jgi:outer membrane receptor protein involved in Fe transport